MGLTGLSGIGHNRGPTVEDGGSWRLQCWRQARAELLPSLPIEVLRTRAARARDLGLQYKTYASVRAATGHDVVAFLFSSNALRVTPGRSAMPEARASKLADVQAGRIALAVGRVDTGALMQTNAVLDAACAAPGVWDGFGAAGRVVREALGRVPGDRILLVGDMDFERDWCAAGRLAGYLTAERYFGLGSGG